MPPLLYCAGLPLVEKRSLTREELSSIRRWGRRITLRSLGFLAGIFGLAAVLVVAGMLTKRPEWETAGAFAGTILIYTNLTGIYIRARDPFRMWRLADRETGIFVFAGILRNTRAAEPTGGALLFERLLDANTLNDQRIDVFGRSGLIWKVNGKTPPRSIRATVSELSEVPEFARIAAKWAIPLPQDPNVSVRERSLSPEELAELKALAVRFFPARRIVFILTSSAFLAGIAWRYGARAFVAETPFWAFLAWWSYQLSKQLIFSIRLFRHLRSARVTIVRTSEAGHSSEAAQEEATWEFLSGSDYTWTLNGQPVFWRGASWSFWKDAEKRFRMLHP